MIRAFISEKLDYRYLIQYVSMLLIIPPKKAPPNMLILYFVLRLQVENVETL